MCAKAIDSLFTELKGGERKSKENTANLKHETKVHRNKRANSQFRVDLFNDMLERSKENVNCRLLFPYPTLANQQKWCIPSICPSFPYSCANAIIEESENQKL